MSLKSITNYICHLEDITQDALLHKVVNFLTLTARILSLFLPMSASAQTALNRLCTKQQKMSRKKHSKHDNYFHVDSSHKYYSSTASDILALTCICLTKSTSRCSPSMKLVTHTHISVF